MGNGAIDHRWVTGDGCSDRHLFDPAGKLREQGAFGGQRPDVDRMETSLINENRNFDARTFGQVGNELRIPDIAIKFKHIAASEGVDDVRGIFMFALQVFRLQGLSEPLFDLVFPRGFVVLVFLQDVCILAGIPACAMRAIFFYQVGAFAEPRIIFRVVSTRLSDILSNREIHLIADHLFIVNFGSPGYGFVDQWIGVHSVPFVFEIPRLMINPCTNVINFMERRTDPFGQHHCRALHGVA